LDTWDWQNHGRRFAADGCAPEAALDMPAEHNLSGTASRAAAVLGILRDGEDHLAIPVLSADIVVAPNAECMIQQAGGHAALLLWSLFDATPSGISMSTSFKAGARVCRMNLKNVGKNG
jgi:hypothetical protein